MAVDEWTLYVRVSLARVVLIESGDLTAPLRMISSSRDGVETCQCELTPLTTSFRRAPLSSSTRLGLESNSAGSSYTSAKAESMTTINER